MPTDSQVELARCRGVRRIVHCLNMLLRVQAPNEQYLATVQHGSLLRANFQFVKVMRKKKGKCGYICRFLLRKMLEHNTMVWEMFSN